MTVLFLTGLLFSCEKENVDVSNNDDDSSFTIEIPDVVVECSTEEIPEPLTIDSINAYIYAQLSANGDFRWDDVDDYFFWSAVVQGEGMVEIGYSEYANIENMSDDEIQQIRAVEEYVIQLVLQHEQVANADLSKEDIVAYTDDFFTHLALHVTLPCTVSAIRKDELVRFADAAYDKLK